MLESVTLLLRPYGTNMFVFFVTYCIVVFVFVLV